MLTIYVISMIQAKRDTNYEFIIKKRLNLASCSSDVVLNARCVGKKKILFQVSCLSLLQ